MPVAARQLARMAVQLMPVAARPVARAAVSENPVALRKVSRSDDDGDFDRIDSSSSVSLDDDDDTRNTGDDEDDEYDDADEYNDGHGLSRIPVTVVVAGIAGVKEDTFTTKRQRKMRPWTSLKRRKA
jgi:hypothetical protein